MRRSIIRPNRGRGGKPGRRLAFLSSVLLLVLLADLAILSPSSSEEPLAFFRVALSLLLIAFLPGFCAVRLLYPKGGLEGMEVIGYSVMISLFVSPSVALLMGALPTGFGTVENPAPLLFALSTVTAIMAVAAFVRCGKS